MKGRKMTWKLQLWRFPMNIKSNLTRKRFWDLNSSNWFSQNQIWPFLSPNVTEWSVIEATEMKADGTSEKCDVFRFSNIRMSCNCGIDAFTRTSGIATKCRNEGKVKRTTTSIIASDEILNRTPPKRVKVQSHNWLGNQEYNCPDNDFYSEANVERISRVSLISLAKIWENVRTERKRCNCKNLHDTKSKPHGKVSLCYNLWQHNYSSKVCYRL